MKRGDESLEEGDGSVKKSRVEEELTLVSSPAPYVVNEDNYRLNQSIPSLYFRAGDVCTLYHVPHAVLRLIFCMLDVEQLLILRPSLWSRFLHHEINDALTNHAERAHVPGVDYITAMWCHYRRGRKYGQEAEEMFEVRVQTKVPAGRYSCFHYRYTSFEVLFARALERHGPLGFTELLHSQWSERMNRLKPLGLWRVQSFCSRDVAQSFSGYIRKRSHSLAKAQVLAIVDRLLILRETVGEELLREFGDYAITFPFEKSWSLENAKNVIFEKHQQVRERLEKVETLVSEYRFLGNLCELEKVDDLKWMALELRDFFEESLESARSEWKGRAERSQVMRGLLNAVGSSASPLDIGWVRNPSYYSGNLELYGELVPATKTYLWASIDATEMPDILSSEILVLFPKWFKQGFLEAVETARNGISTQLSNLTENEIFACSLREKKSFVGILSGCIFDMVPFKARTQIRLKEVAELSAEAKSLMFDIGTVEDLEDRAFFDRERPFCLWYRSCAAQLERLRIVSLFCEATRRPRSDLLMEYVSDAKNVLSVGEEVLEMLPAEHCQHFGISTAAIRFVFLDDPGNLAANVLLVGDIMRAAIDVLGDDIELIPKKIPVAVTKLLKQRKRDEFLDAVLKLVVKAKAKSNK